MTFQRNPLQWCVLQYRQGPCLTPMMQCCIPATEKSRYGSLSQTTQTKQKQQLVVHTPRHVMGSPRSNWLTNLLVPCHAIRCGDMVTNGGVLGQTLEISSLCPYGRNGQFAFRVSNRFLETLLGTILSFLGDFLRLLGDSPRLVVAVVSQSRV